MLLEGPLTPLLHSWRSKPDLRSNKHVVNMTFSTNYYIYEAAGCGNEIS